jgi:cation diffusion facilitator CzcD-associated flavoprotein CzcO
MMYNAECWTMKGQHIYKMSVAEMRMLLWICGHKRKDRIRNNDIRDKLRVASIQEKLVQHHLRWFGHIQQRPPEVPVCSGILSRPENIRRGRDRPRLAWEEIIKKYLNE